ncbi:hypothetical protein I302_100504 [Kwoniella bestiolae CBS 10118]|uniref:Cytoplasmic protein n=1 Tax=Kwoniella bestiolae CBS 10118 TaxID=1296100 RepID=A0A1B9G5C0_9TREE|nr:hypothetical protein I302_03877 [Kwoniella bestiolae CBS 10118]OCF26198.1 hypothetical protein I302_03877 [Kwoniella bestiolae CBS 10118]
MSGEQPVVLITGANRGLGSGLTQEYSQKGWKVIAAVRDPSTMTSVEGVCVVKLDAGELDDAKDAVQEMKEKYGINHIDVVIANSAVGSHSESILDISPEEYTNHFKVNTRGVLLLYQATRDLLLRGKERKFVVISSILAQLSRPWHKVGMVTYGTSKVALNYLARGIHFEEPDLITFTLDPGHVDTRLGHKASEFLGYAPPRTVEETVRESYHIRQLA